MSVDEEAMDAAMDDRPSVGDRLKQTIDAMAVAKQSFERAKSELRSAEGGIERTKDDLKKAEAVFQKALEEFNKNGAPW